jgi:glycerol-3-phosphate dehydrogenase (NAD(P)+)
MVTILGKGAWGQALASLLEENKKEYVFWDKVSPIDPESLVVLAVPAQAIREVLTKNKENLKKVTIINTAKGIEKETNKLPFEIAREVLGDEINYSAMFGPSFASEVKDKMPTFVNLCCLEDGNTTICPMVRGYFQTDYFRVRQTSSVQAIELAGALKNIYAIACGITLGVGFGENTRAQLVVLAYEETIKLCEALGYEVAKDAIEGIMGDLVLTCGSMESRNFRFGKLIAKVATDEALKEIGSTVEGYNNCLSVPYLKEKSGLNLRLADFVYRTIMSNDPENIESQFRELIRET